MAYIVAKVAYDSGGTTNAFGCALPPHEESDLLLALLTQDTGSGTFSATDWDVIGTHAASSGQRSGWLGRIAPPGGAADPVFASTLTDDMVVVIYVIRGADTSGTVADAIHALAKTDVTISGSQTTPTLTTTIPDCLVLYSSGYDGQGTVVVDVGPVTFDARVDRNAYVSCATGHYQQQAAGDVPQITFHNRGNDGGTAWVLAINNATGGALAPAMTGGAETLLRFSGAGTDINPTRAALSLVASTIEGKTVDSGGFTALTVQTDDYSPGGSYEYYNSSTSVTDGWVGETFELASVTDLTDSVVSVAWRMAITDKYGALGWIVVFVDDVGAWAAYRLLRPYQTPPSKPVNSIIRCGQATPIDSGGGTIDWSSIAKIGFAYHRTSAAATTAQGIGVKRVTAINAPIMVAGSSAAPVSAGAIAAIFDPDGIGLPGIYDAQGQGQALLRSSVQIGDGSRQTYYNGVGTSIEFPSAFVALGEQKLWNVPEDGVEIRVKASASDTLRFGGGAIRAPLRQKFVIDPASSPSASYDFSGAVFIGMAVTWQAGIVCNGADFVDGYTITANGGTFVGCSIRRSLSAAALTTADPGEISNCEFISAGTGHAIEITAPGTYTFSGNTFSGYGADGTTDAAIYNNSGGAVTLNISGGGDTPTVRNGTGASTTVNNNATLTLEGLVVGSSIRVELVSDGSLVEYRVAGYTTEVFSVASSVAYRIKVRKGTSAPKYQPYQTQTGVLAGDTTVFISQTPDPIA